MEFQEIYRIVGRNHDLDAATACKRRRGLQRAGTQEPGGQWGQRPPQL